MSQAFELFERAVRDHDHTSYLPRYLRGSVAENLPRILWRKRRWGKKEFHRDRDKRPKAERLFREAMRLDPERKAGFVRASELLRHLQGG